MNVVKLFIKRLFWNLVHRRKTYDELFEMLKAPDIDVADLLWVAYLRKVKDICHLMVIVYDDDHEFHQATREVAGETVLEVLKHDVGFMFLPGVLWTNPENGRLAYLVGVGCYLPKLRCKASSVVRNYFYIHERRAFTGVW